MEPGRKIRVHLCGKGDTGAGALQPAFRLSMRHIFQSPQVHTANMSAQNGSWVETAAKYISDKIGSVQGESFSLSILFSIQQTKFPGGTEKFTLQAMIVCFCGTHPRHDHEIIAKSKRRLMEPIDLSEPSSDSVSDNGITDFIGHSEADAIALESVFPDVQRKTRGRGAVSFGVETPKLMILF